MTGGVQASRREFEARLIARAWKDPRFAEELRRDPKTVIARELAARPTGRMLAPNVTIRVVEETPSIHYLRVPFKPAGADALPDAQLAQIAAGSPGSGGGYDAPPPPGPQNDGYLLADAQLGQIAGGTPQGGGYDSPPPPPGPQNDGYLPGSPRPGPVNDGY